MHEFSWPKFMDSLPIREKGVINWLLMYQKYHNTWANRCSSTFTVTILKYLSVRFLQQLLLGNFKFRIYPQMFAKTTFILKDGWTPARVSRCHIAASQHAASIAARSPIHARGRLWQALVQQALAGLLIHCSTYQKKFGCTFFLEPGPQSVYLPIDGKN